MIKIVFFDFDNTLYSHRSNQIPASAKRAIKALKDNGILVALATGRCLYELEEFFDLDEYGFDYRVLQNGLIVMGKDHEIIYSYPVTGVAKENAIRIFNEKSLPLVITTIDDYYINYIDDVVRETAESVSSPCPRIKEYSGEEIYLFSIFPGKVDDIYGFVESRFPGCCPTLWHEGAYDVSFNGHSKAEGIKELASYLGIAMEDTMAFGDAENDIMMIKEVGVGIALGNGEECIKEMADYITDDIDEDGIYNALRHFNLI